MFQRVRQIWGTDRRGAVVVLVAVSSTIMIGFAALTIDTGNMYIVRTELQRAADAAALAAVAKLTHYQAGVSEADAKNEAERIAEGNPVDAQKTKLDLTRDVEFGRAVFDATTQKYKFTAGSSGTPTAVRVTVRKTADSPNGSLHLFFANFYGSDKNMSARAAAMIVPRDIAVVGDLSGSMNDDSELQNYKQTGINLWNIWVCLPIEKGNNGVGNGIDPPPPGNPPVNDGYGTSPGNPGNRGGADPKTDPALSGPTWGRMSTWGTLTMDSNYDPTKDAGLLYLPYGKSWSSNTDLKNWLTVVGYNTAEINAICSSSNDGSGYYKYRVQVALGLSRWDSGISGGLWSTLPPGKTKKTKGNADSKISSNELASLVTYPYSGGSWNEYIDTYMRSTSSAMYGANANFLYRFGLKTFVNYLLESHPSYADTPDLCKTPEQPLQAVKDAVSFCMDQITQQESDDQVSLEIFAQTAHHMNNLTKTYNAISSTLTGMQAGHYDSWTYTGGGIDLAIAELTSSRARANAAKVVFLLSDGQANVTRSGSVGDYSGGKTYALQEAQAATNKGIQFYCVSMGVDADRPFMQQIANMGGGEEFFAVGTIDQYSAQLKAIFAELGSKRPVRLIE
jgi:Flp pilus assembly protein TadG